MLNQFRLKSFENPLLPSFKLAIHITRPGEKCDDDQVVYSKPDFDIVMNQFIEDMSDASKSILVYACGPGSMVNQLWDASMKTPLKKNGKRIRTDFYHESFEF
jgi:predicted ferric reductase